MSTPARRRQSTNNLPYPDLDYPVPEQGTSEKKAKTKKDKEKRSAKKQKLDENLSDVVTAKGSRDKTDDEERKEDNPGQQEDSSESDRPRKKSKGKNKETTPKPVEIGEDEDSESDIEVFTGFVGLTMDAEPSYAENKKNQLVTEFASKPPLYFKDHMAPFRGIMGELKNETEKTKNDHISSYFMVNPSKKLLVATSGKQTQIIKGIY
jgi:hypothetical protein